MGRQVRLILAMLLVLQLSFCATFTECFPSAPLDRFWESPSYEKGNPYVLDAVAFKFYFFEFGQSADKLELAGIGFSEPLFAMGELSPAQQKRLSPVLNAIEDAKESLEQSEEGKANAGRLSTGAQNAVKEIAGYPSLWSHLSSKNAVLEVLGDAMLLAAVADYAVSYPQHYWGMVGGATDAFDDLEFAASQLASEADSRMGFLAKAGASSPGYSGKAKAAYFEAQSLLANPQFCLRESYEGIYRHFASRPSFPDFEQAGVDEHIVALSVGQQSSIVSMARLLPKLEEAEAAMEQEQATAQRGAQVELRLFETEVESLGQERLELIGGTQLPTEGTVAETGTGFGGVYGGYLEARKKLQQSQSLFSEATALEGSEETNYYLADSIGLFEKVSQLAKSSRQSTLSVRQAAEEMAVAQHELAASAIAQAEASINAGTGSFADVAGQESAKKLLAAAKKELVYSDSKRTLGERFAASRNALERALEARAAVQSAGSASAFDAARRSVYSLSALIQQAQHDGLELGFEKSRLSEYQSLLSSTSSKATAEAVEKAADDDVRSIALRLYGKYQHLEEEYGVVIFTAEQIREYDRGFLPKLDELSPYFVQGRLSVSAAVGHLPQLESELQKLREGLPAKVAASMTDILTAETEVAVLEERPVLGKQTTYAVFASATNPTSLSFDGPVSFSFDSEVSLLPSDVVGKRPKEVFYRNGKVEVVLDGIGAHEKVDLAFEKMQQPVQIVSLAESCQSADEVVEVEAVVSFTASRDLPLVAFSYPVAPGAVIKEVGAATAEVMESADGTEIRGTLQGVAEGKGKLSLAYAVEKPLKLAVETQTFTPVALGEERVSKQLVVESDFDCKTATVTLEEPFGVISDASVVSLGSEKAALVRAVQLGAGSSLSFSISPLSKGKRMKFAVSYLLADSQRSFERALADAERLGTVNALALSQARSLVAQGKVREAMAILAAAAPSLQVASDSPVVELELEKANLVLAEASTAVLELSSIGALEQSAELSKLSFALNSSVAEARLHAKPDRAAALMRGAVSDYSSALSGLAWKNSVEAAKKYAEVGISAEAMQTLIAQSQRDYSQGEHLSSYLASSKALVALGEAASGGQQEKQQVKSKLQALSSEFSSLAAETEKILAQYGAQHAALSGQSKRSLPVTPAAAAQKIKDAEKGMDAALKNKDVQAGLLLANSSYAKLVAVNEILSSSLASIESSASSSLEVAHAALAEIRQKEGSSPSEDAQAISREVLEAERLYAEGLYADSTMASDRAIGAANELLASRNGLDVKTLALSVLSMLFVAGAIYYFWRMQKPAQAEKKKLRKADGH